ANRQAQAQQLSQSAQQLAQAMRQASQGQNPGNSGNKSGSNSTAGNQSGGKNPGNSPGNQPGGNQQQTASAGQQMQQALNQLKAMANGAQASAAGQQQQQQQNNGNGPQQVAQARQITSHGYGSEREGLNFRNDPGTVDHKVDPSLAPTDTNPDGRLIASSLVKDNAPIKGDSKASLAKVAAAAEQDTTDEVDEDRIPRSAQNAVKEYFQTLKDNGQN
ncbi:MAG TPA: hypothetical protein VHY57_09190, partial [Rhizomicrobium sp.]|nr:hypothetical protein [Rhizomicrobium sp.]